MYINDEWYLCKETIVNVVGGANYLEKKKYKVNKEGLFEEVKD